MSDAGLDERRPFNNEPPVQPGEPPGESDVERRARSMGWAPREEWKGSPDKWKTAEEFVSFLDQTNHIGVLRENVRRMEAKFDAQGRELNEAKGLIKDQTDVIRQLKEWADRSEKVGYERARQELEQKQRLAVANADTAAHDVATEALRRLDADHQRTAAPPPPRQPDPPPRQPDPPPVAAPGPSPEMRSWMDENGWWFFRDEDMKQTAIAIYGGQVQAHPDSDDTRRLAEVLRRIKLMYPEKFVNQRRQMPAPVSEPGAPPPPAPPSGGKVTYESLPADAKAACDKFVRTIPGYTKEQYIQEWVRQEEIARARAGG